MRVLPAATNEYRWLAARAHCVLTSDFKAIKAERKSEILGMVGFCNWTHSSVEIHLAMSEPFVLKHLIKPMFEYPFVAGDRKLLLATTNSKHKRSIRLSQHLGFKEIARIKDGCDLGDDKVILGLRKEDCGWLKPGA